MSIPFFLKIIYDISDTIFKEVGSMRLSRREKILYLVIFFLLMVLGGGHVKNYYDTVIKDLKSENSGFISPKDLSDVEEKVASSISDERRKPDKIMVHISGAVVNPGVVTVDSGTRVKDVIEFAGGVYDTADLDRINLAKIVHDEQKIYIPRKGEAIFARIDSNDFDQSSDNFDRSSSSDGKVNINVCSKSELIALPGIGEKTAEKILEYRKEHAFDRIEDVMKVKGIGEKKFEAIKNLICIH